MSRISELLEGFDRLMVSDYIETYLKELQKLPSNKDRITSVREFFKNSKKSLLPIIELEINKKFK